MAVENIAGNLYRLRAAKKISMGEISKRCGLSRVAYSNIENGKAQPKSVNLIKLSQILEVDIKDLLAPPPEFQSLRFRSGNSHSSREENSRLQLIYDAARWLKDYNSLEKALGTDMVKFKCPKSISQDPVKASVQYRNSLGLDAKEPVIDIIGLLHKAGIKIRLSSFNIKNMFGFSIGVKDGGPALIINNSENITIERRIFTAAHELGHILLHKSSFEMNDIEKTILEKEENEANKFAGYFLLPRDGFEKEWDEAKGLHWVDAVFHIKRKFRVSYQAVLQRLIDNSAAEAKEIYPAFTIEVKKKYNISLKNHNEPFPLTVHDFVEDRLNRMVREAYEKEEISLSRAAEILKLSIEEMKDLNNVWKALS